MLFLQPIWKTYFFFFALYFYVQAFLIVIEGWLILGNVCYHTPFGKLQIIPPHFVPPVKYPPENLFYTLVIVLPFPLKAVFMGL